MMDGESLVSDATTKNHSGDVSDSNSSLITSSKFKGVVSQPNGHWGAQIYANHHRIWLGTFKSEKDAAMAYDSAAIRLRNGHSQRNFPWTAVTLQEPGFQSQFSTEAVLSMIKDGSYTARFSDFLRAHDLQGSHQPNFSGSQNDMKLRQLFQKELTPSDVGKLNRFVIPKRYAIKYFPAVCDANKRDSSYDLELIFFDRLMRSWKFRYCYWKSSQSFVFTRGWIGFAKEKGLRARDRVIFSSYESGNQKLWVIDVAYHDGAAACGTVPETTKAMQSSNGDDEEELEEDLDEDGDGDGDGDDDDVEGEEDVGVGGFKLFGVRIV